MLKFIKNNLSQLKKMVNIFFEPFFKLSLLQWSAISISILFHLVIYRLLEANYFLSKSLKIVNSKNNLLMQEIAQIQNTFPEVLEKANNAASDVNVGLFSDGGICCILGTIFAFSLGYVVLSFVDVCYCSGDFLENFSEPYQNFMSMFLDNNSNLFENLFINFQNWGVILVVLFSFLQVIFSLFFLEKIYLLHFKNFIMKYQFKFKNLFILKNLFFMLDLKQFFMNMSLFRYIFLLYVFMSHFLVYKLIESYYLFQEEIQIAGNKSKDLINELEGLQAIIPQIIHKSTEEVVYNQNVGAFFFGYEYGIVSLLVAITVCGLAGIKFTANDCCSCTDSNHQFDFLQSLVDNNTSYIFFNETSYVINNWFIENAILSHIFPFIFLVFILYKYRKIKKALITNSCFIKK